MISSYCNAQADSNNIPSPAGLPILGNTLQLKKAPLHSVLESWARQFGALYKIKVLGKTIHVISDTGLIHELLNRRPDDFRRRSILEDAAHEMGINGIFTSEGQRWKTQRKLVMKSFSNEHLEAFLPDLLKVTQRLVRRWKHAANEGKPVPILNESKHYTVDVMANLIFGYDINTLENSKEDIIRTHFNKIFPMFNKRINSPFFPYWKYVYLPADYSLRRSMNEIRHIFITRIAENRQRFEKDPELTKTPKTLLDTLLCSKNEHGEKFSDDDVFANVFSILLAGEDAVANTIAWTLHFITENIDVQNNIRREASSAFPHGEPYRFDKISSQLPYTEAVLRESMRLKPVAPMISLQAVHDVKINHLNLKKDATLLLLPRVNTFRSDSFYQADTFLPERWLQAKKDGNEQNSCPHAHNEKASLPFGTGPRYCAGSKLALYEMKVLFAILCQHFDMKKESKASNIGEKYAFLMEPTPFNITLKALDKS